MFETSLDFFIALTGAAKNGMAYLDPGSGSYILQILIAAILGGAIMLRTQWARIKSYFRKKANPDQEDEESE
jgi:hypothetical protein